MNFSQVSISISEEDEMDDKRLKNKQVNQKPLGPRMTLSDLFLQTQDVNESCIIVELPFSGISSHRLYYVLFYYGLQEGKENAMILVNPFSDNAQTQY